VKITIKAKERMTLEDFADKHNLEMIVREYDWGWAASFENAEVKDGSVLISEYGSGSDPESAILNYKKIISDKTLVIGAYTTSRREICVPVLE